MAKEKPSHLAIHRELGKGEFRRHYGSSRSPGCGGIAYWSHSKFIRGKTKKIFYCQCGKHVTTKSHLGDKLDIRTIPYAHSLDG